MQLLQPDEESCRSEILYARVYDLDLSKGIAIAEIFFVGLKKNRVRTYGGRTLVAYSTTSSSFRTLHKIRHKTRIRAPIRLKFGIRKGRINANLSTKFGRNPMNIHGVITDYLRKIRSKVCHAHRVNRLKNELKIAM